ncbi:Scarecrow-like protein 3 [Linum perenne]
MSLSPGIGSPFPWLRDLQPEERGLCLIQLLRACANHVASGSIENANIGLGHISSLASPEGDTMQRIAAYFTEALADRMLKAWPGLHKALNSTRTSSSASEEMIVQKLFFELCPFLKLSYVITNQAIVEAMEGEKMIHIVDLNSFEPAQWIELLRSLSARPEGPPHLRITGVHEHKEVLDRMGARLVEEAEKLDIPFQFNSIVSKLESLDLELLRVKTGEALAVSSVLQLHSLLATDEELVKNARASKNHRIRNNQKTLGEWLEINDFVTNYYSTTTPSPDSALSPLASYSPTMGTFLSSLCALSPKIMVITEQESDHNGYPLTERVAEAMNFYAALFDCLESSTDPRASLERQKVEKMMFGKEIKNIIACEGMERKERHEKLEKWILRVELAGFGRVPLSYDGMWQGNRLLQSYNYGGYKIKDKQGCLLICWHDRPLYSISAWRHRR